MTQTLTPPQQAAGSGQQTVTVSQITSAPLFVAPTAAEKRDFAMELRAQTVACRVRHEKLGVRKALTREQLKTAAAEFGADAKVLSAAKKLIDTKAPAYRKCVLAKRQAGSYWKSVTTPYPEPGVRLIRKSAVAGFEAKMEEYQTQLIEAAAELQEQYEPLRDKARVDLGDLFDGSDYPARVDTAFDLDWDFPSVEPSDQLKQLHPDIYKREEEKMKGRFDEAVRLTEEFFATQLRDLVSHLAERLKGDVDGKPKVFRDTAVENLNAFFDTFKNLNMGSSAALQQLVTQAQTVIAGKSAGDLRDAPDLRTQVAVGLTEITSALDELMIAKPKRLITLDDES